MIVSLFHCHLNQKIPRHILHTFILFHDVIDFFPLLIGGTLIEDDIAVIILNLLILKDSDIKDGVLKPESHEKERHGAAYPEDGHKETLLVAHKVAHRSLPDKTQAFPHKRHSL